MKVISNSNETMRLTCSKARCFILTMMEQVVPEDSWRESRHGSFIVVEPNDHPIDDFFKR